MTSFSRRVRKFVWRGGVYLIRDVWVRDASRPGGVRFVACEYAVRNSNGSKKWLPTYEGVEFATIAPHHVLRAA